MSYDEVGWKDVAPLARVIFRTWLSEGDLEWARTTWCILGEAGLTEVHDPADTEAILRVRARMLVLGAFYHAFAWQAWEEGYANPRGWLQSSEFWSCSEDLQLLNPVLHAELERTAIVAGNQFPSDEYSAIVVGEIIDREHSKVLQALREGYGDDGNLFISMWLTPGTAGLGWRQYPAGIRDDVLNTVDIGSGKLPAWEWLTSGAQI